MSSQLSSQPWAKQIIAALTAMGIALPVVPRVEELPVIGDAYVQAYNNLPANVKQQVPPQLRPKQPGQEKKAPAKPAPVAPDAQAKLHQLVQDVVGRHGGRAAISVAGAGRQITVGDNRAEPAFSTMKVPLSIAALRQNPAFAGDARLAITVSDNPAAHRMFAQVPASAYGGVIAEAGSKTTTPAGYEMGTLWTTADQAQFASGLRCVRGHEPVLDLMGQITRDQRWGLGQIGGARFKGGWNVHQGGYLTRQFGLIPGPNGDIAVAITAFSNGGYAESTQMLNELAHGIEGMRGGLPTSRC